MAALVCDPNEVQDLIKRRQETGADRYDEVWEGLYVMSPLADPEHQWLVGELFGILRSLISETGLGQVYPGANVTDCADDWRQNYRCPDVVVVLKGSEARCRIIGAAFLGGPDFLIEVRSPEDKTFEKLDFYATIGVRELLVVDRDTRAVTLFRLESGRLTQTSPCDGWLESEVVGLSFRTTAEPILEVQTIQLPYRHWRI